MHAIMSTRHDPRYIALIRHLKRVRRAAHVTQKDLADKLGFSQSSIAKVEGMERRLDVIELIDWLQALGYDFEHFLYEVSILEENPEEENPESIGRWIWHVRNDLIFASDNVYALFGLDSESMHGSSIDFQRFLCLIEKNDRKRVCAEIEEILLRKSCHSLSFRFHHPDGSRRTVVVHGMMQLDERGRAYRARGMVRDVTHVRMRPSKKACDASSDA
jgi:PAS domain S-box-containing protein